MLNRTDPWSKCGRHAQVQRVLPTPQQATPSFTRAAFKVREVMLVFLQVSVMQGTTDRYLSGQGHHYVHSEVCTIPLS